VILGADERALSVARALVSDGFDVRAVRPPTVPEGTARLRISLTLNAGEDATARLLDTLATVLQRVPAESTS
jgi:8-amino-7-oxononanoate synthase